MDELWEELTKQEGTPLEYEQHPSDSILSKYLRGDLSNEVPSPNILHQLTRGELAEEAWNGFTVSAHVHTCTRCTERVAQLRLEAGRESPEEEMSTRAQRIGVALRRWTHPAPRLVWAASFVVALGIGVALGSLFNITRLGSQPMEVGKAEIDQALGQVRSPDGVDLTPSAVLRMAQLLQQAGIDLAQFDFYNLPEYETQSGDTLKSIAQHQYGHGRFWILIYFLNVESLQQGLLTADNLGEVELPEELVLLLP